MRALIREHKLLLVGDYTHSYHFKRSKYLVRPRDEYYKPNSDDNTRDRGLGVWAGNGDVEDGAARYRLLFDFFGTSNLELN
ncbi:hypothetical protein TSUD_360190 [Trifolium subterraneum]|uniref:Uncharacterized protein n=1 Tax=Trifolium subterraneum TaxID=3900 RepID=A0A2Z6MBU6_TRISU|nr:hypothetical protein TSUD_360190 [Trifolium subterraneum]